MSDARTILADKCTHWIAHCTSKATRDNLSKIDEYHKRSSEEEILLVNQLIAQVHLSIPDLSCDEAVTFQYSDYWIDLLNNSFQNKKLDHRVSTLDQAKQSAFLLKMKHDKDEVPLLLELEYVNDQQDYRIKTIMLRSHRIGIQFITNLVQQVIK
jgi:hypothetical protein